MKLSEVIKAIEDGSKTKYKSDEFLIRERGGDIWFEFEEEPRIFINPSRQFEEIKPLRQWSEKELMLFKLLPDWAKWIARDEDCTICVYENEPNISRSGDFHQAISDNHDYKELDAFDFLTITFEESPVYIGDLKGE